jgi:dethiobiotin synthetase
MSKAYFITATGTDAGKTWLTAGVAAVCHARGIAVRALKPVMSGYDAAHPAASDAGRLLEKVGAGGTAADVEGIAPWRFAAPLSPDLAAARESRSLDFDALVAWCDGEILRNRAAGGLLLIEGIGGALVPLDKTHTVREWIAALDIPVVLVAGSYLGALSHTLATLAALRAAGIEPAALVVNASPDSPVALSDTLASLAPHVGTVPLLALQRDDALGLARLADFLLGTGGP